MLLLLLLPFCCCWSFDDDEDKDEEDDADDEDFCISRLISRFELRNWLNEDVNFLEADCGALALLFDVESTGWLLLLLLLFISLLLLFGQPETTVV